MGEIEGETQRASQHFHGCIVTTCPYLHHSLPGVLSTSLLPSAFLWSVSRLPPWCTLYMLWCVCECSQCWTPAKFLQDDNRPGNAQCALSPGHWGSRPSSLVTGTIFKGLSKQAGHICIPVQAFVVRAPLAAISPQHACLIVTPLPVAWLPIV